MSHSILQALAEHGIILPVPAAPVATYVPFVQTGSLLVVSGQLPFEAGKIAVTGHLGVDVTIEDGQRAARLCVINLLAQLQAAVAGDWSRVVRCVRLGVFVSSGNDFTDQPKVDRKSVG